MCNYTIKARHAAGLGAVAEIDGRPVLQPASNRVVTVEAGRPFKKPVASAPRVSPPPLPLPCALSAPPPCTGDKAAAHTDAEVIVVVTGSSPSAVAATTPVTLTKLPIPASPKPKVAAKTVHRRSEDPNGLNSSGEIKPTSPKSAPRPAPALRKKSKRSGQAAPSVHPHVTLLDRLDLKAVPGSIAAAQREQATLRQAQRKMRIAHYGRTPGKAVLVNSSGAADDGAPEEKRCSFITSNSDPIYVAYHDDEWGVPVHDDKMLFELLVLAGAQVGLDWTTILKRREDFR
uniref:DNA-3-methyladenine glycosylase 1 n=2 Tax=Anthurium amnicola TaxID=1678845 RepID=A0A1D1YPP6_9ARAE